MSYRADKLGDGRTKGRTDAGNDNTRRPKLTSGKNEYIMSPYDITPLLVVLFPNSKSGNQIKLDGGKHNEYAMLTQKIYHCLIIK